MRSQLLKELMRKRRSKGSETRNMSGATANMSAGTVDKKVTGLMYAGRNSLTSDLEVRIGTGQLPRRNRNQVPGPRPLLLMERMVERFIADSGIILAITSGVVTERNRVQWSPVDGDEPDYDGVTEMQLILIGRTKFFVKFKC